MRIRFTVERAVSLPAKKALHRSSTRKNRIRPEGLCPAAWGTDSFSSNRMGMLLGSASTKKPPHKERMLCSFFSSEKGTEKEKPNGINWFRRARLSSHKPQYRGNGHGRKNGRLKSRQIQRHVRVDIRTQCVLIDTLAAQPLAKCLHFRLCWKTRPQAILARMGHGSIRAKAKRLRRSCRPGVRSE